MQRNILIIIAVVVIVAIVGAFALTHHGNNDEGMLNTEIKFLSQATLKNGEAIQFELNDEKGQHLDNQNITITFVENGENQTYSIITDVEGKGSLVLNNEAPGSYDVIVSYNGTLKYNGCSAKQTITVSEGASSDTASSDTAESGSSSQPTQSNSSAGTSLYNGNSSSQGNLHYDSQYNFYYDDNGVIRGGQNDGMSAEYMRNAYESGNMVDEEGNLQ